MKTRPCQPGDILVSKTFDYDIKYVIEVIEPKAHPDKGVTTDCDVKLQLSILLPITALKKSNGIKILEEVTGNFWGVSYNALYRLKTKIFFTKNLIDTLVEAAIFADEECRKIQKVVSLHEKSILDQKNARDKIYSQIMIQEND